MKSVLNALHQPVGEDIKDWVSPPPPPRQVLTGRYCRVEPLDPARHAADLHEANDADAEGSSWTYLPYGPFASLEAYRSWLDPVATADDPIFFAIVRQADDRAVGLASYLRLQPAAGVVEVGHLHFAPVLQRTPAATEAMFLMMRQAFELGYRRYEWKCDALNEASRAAALRLGFTYEGTFRQATMYKGRNRDTAWFSVLDSEWPALREAFERWLAPDNFDAEGRQLVRLGELIKTAMSR